MPDNAYADCYEGTINVDISKGTRSNMAYFACFIAKPNGCTYKYCGNGWIANYTTSDGVTQGYPQNEKYTPVFSAQINSAADFVIKKDDSLSEEFNRLIDIAVSQFDPTAVSPRTRVPTATNKFVDSNLINGDTIDFASDEQRIYIPEFSFTALEGDDTKTLF